MSSVKQFNGARGWIVERSSVSNRHATINLPSCSKRKWADLVKHIIAEQSHALVRISAMDEEQRAKKTKLKHNEEKPR